MNIKNIVNGQMLKAQYTSLFASITWIIASAIGIDAAIDVVREGNMSGLPVVISYIAGGQVGIFIGMYLKHKR